MRLILLLDEIVILEWKEKTTIDNIKQRIDIKVPTSLQFKFKEKIFNITMPLKRAPVSNGPIAFPADAADKCTPRANAFLSGYLWLRTAKAGGCQILGPAPSIINAMNPKKIQLDADKNEIKRNPINIIKALKDINIPSLLLNKSVNRPAGTFISPEEILFAVANAPIWTPERERLSFINGIKTWTDDENICFTPWPTDIEYRNMFFLIYWMFKDNLTYSGSSPLNSFATGPGSVISSILIVIRAPIPLETTTLPLPVTISNKLLASWIDIILPTGISLV